MADNRRIRIKMGPVEVEFEGTEKILKDELLDMVKAVSNLYQESGGKLQSDDSGSGGGGGSGSGGIHKGSTNQFAAKLGGSTGGKLVTAAGAKLHFADGKASFTRTDLLKQARAATTYYKKNYSTNLTKILAGLVKNGTFNEPSDKTYALSDETIKPIGANLAK